MATRFTALWLCVGEGSERGQSCCLASGDYLRGSCLSGTCPFASHFTFSLSPLMPLVCFQHCPGAKSQRGWFCMSPKSVAGPLREVSWGSCSFFCCPTPHWFLQAEVTGTYLPGIGTLGWVVWSGTGTACSHGIPPYFYPPHVNVGPPVPPPLCTSPCFSKPLYLHPSYLSGWMWLL